MLQDIKNTEEEINNWKSFKGILSKDGNVSFVDRVSREKQALTFLLIYLQMPETSGLDHIGGITKKGSAAVLFFMSWSQDTK